MEIFEQRHVLDSFSIIVDSREQKTKRAEKRYEAFSVPYHRGTISFGDYTYNAVLPNGSFLYDEGETVTPHCSIERKQDLDELAYCFGGGRDRFRREWERAVNANAKMYLVVENASWENLYNGRYRSRFNPDALAASLHAWLIRYNIGLYMCKEETSGKLIQDILYRDLKERVERGAFG